MREGKKGNMRFEEGVIRLKEKITGGRKRQEAQEGEKVEKMKIYAQEEEKGQEGAVNEATEGEEAGEAFRNALKNSDLTEEMQREEALRNVAKNPSMTGGISAEEAENALRMAISVFSEVWESFSNGIKRMGDGIREACERSLFYFSLDKWQKEKLEMPNNGRRRRGIPMVRRQQHLKNERNQRCRRYERRKES